MIDSYLLIVTRKDTETDELRPKPEIVAREVYPDAIMLADAVMAHCQFYGVELAAKERGVLNDLVRGDTLAEMSAETDQFALKAGPLAFQVTRVKASVPDQMAGPPGEPEDPVYLYILMSTDVAGMNPGKAVAQGTHAANQMVYEARRKANPELHALLDEWEAETPQGFGTCICLGVTNAEMEQAVSLAGLMGVHAGVTHDPSYPLLIGAKMHFLPVNTCGYIFGRKSACAPVTSRFKLMA